MAEYMYNADELMSQSKITLAEDAKAVCRKCPLHCGTGTEYRDSSITSNRSLGARGQIDYRARERSVGSNNSRFSSEASDYVRLSSIDNQTFERKFCDCRHLVVREQQKKLLLSMGTGSVSASATSSTSTSSSVSKTPTVVACCNCAVFDVNFADKKEPELRKEFDIKQHGWRDWEKSDTGEIEEKDLSPEDKKQSIIEAMVQSVNDEKRKSVLQQVKKTNVVPKEKKSVSERYGISTRKVFYVDPEEGTSANN